VLRAKLDAGGKLGPPDGVLINGRGPYGSVLSVEAGRTYRLRVSNVGIAASLNVRIQGHILKVVETEGSHIVQNEYSDLDIHVGQSYSVLVTANSRDPGDFYVVASTRFTSPVLTGVAILRYAGSSRRLSGPLPPGPTIEIAYSLNQARTIRYI
jgi:FtsP/CotA-like multicopper oxidase with cupredoxin domain